ncbi:MAG TPA: TIGR03435 family protein [Terracidiphilus sp.]|nr:TIGR03435 family protein [Terracidiphilus sp.]
MLANKTELMSKIYACTIMRRWAISAAVAFSLVTMDGAPKAKAQTAPATTPDTASTDIVGIWQGTLHIAQANRDLRTEIKIAKATDGSYKLTFYSIDQGGQPIVASKTTFQSGALLFTIDRIEGKYEGKMSADGKTITGTWTQGPNPIPLNLERTTEEAAWPIPEPPKPMAADADPSFDVVTIKPSKPGTPGKLFTFRGRHAITVNTNMHDLIAFAYGLHAKQILGEPDWFGNDLFDIDGVPDVEGQPSSAQFRTMMQKLLADRFQLKFHHDERELSVYIITVAPGGPKLEKSDTPLSQGQGFFFRGFGDLNVTNQTITDFAHGMQGAVMDKPVVDHTGLTDRYNFRLKWTPDDSQFGQFRGTNGPVQPPAGDNPNAPPSLYTAMPEQLGLKIEAGKAMDDVIVIDHVEKPSAN